jgi:hypothetical protein
MAMSFAVWERFERWFLLWKRTMELNMGVQGFRAVTVYSVKIWSGMNDFGMGIAVEADLDTLFQMSLPSDDFWQNFER